MAGPLPGVEISAPTLAEPANATLILVANQPVALRFDAASSNSVRPFWYELQVATDSAFATLAVQARIDRPDTGGSVTYQVSAVLDPERTYYWRVRAVDGANTGPYSAVRTFEIATPIVLTAPTPVSPVGGVTTDSNRVTTVVRNVTATGPVSNPVLYRFEAALDSAFAGAVVSSATQGTSETTSAQAELVFDRLYYWRTRASTERRGTTIQGPWSAVETFRTPNAPAPVPTPPPGGGGSGNSADALNLGQVSWLHQDVSAWPVTSTVTNVAITHDSVCVDHTKAGQLPTSVFGDILVEGNVWIFAQIGGRWYGATWDWLRPGQTCKSITAEEFGRDQIRISPMDASWVPRAGDTIGLMVSTRARDGVSAGQERTNVVLVTWPY